MQRKQTSQITGLAHPQKLLPLAIHDRSKQQQPQAGGLPRHHNTLEAGVVICLASTLHQRSRMALGCSPTPLLGAARVGRTGGGLGGGGAQQNAGYMYIYCTFSVYNICEQYTDATQNCAIS